MGCIGETLPTVIAASRISKETTGSHQKLMAMSKIPAHFLATIETICTLKMQGACVIKNDLEAVNLWLAQCNVTPGTYKRYHIEAERLLLWTIIQQQTSLLSLADTDILAYRQFLANPQPTEYWVCSTRKTAPRASNNWRPFSGPLSPASIHSAFLILNGLFRWLAHSGYIIINPVPAARQRGDLVQRPTVVRQLSKDCWHEVKTTLENLPASTVRQSMQAARYRLLFALLYFTDLRVVEMPKISMGAVLSQLQSDGRRCWWINVVTSGGKTRLVSVAEQVIVELRQYREAHGLEALPRPGESRPLILPLTGAEKQLARGAISQMIHHILNRTAERLRKRGPDWHAQAEEIAGASTHWIHCDAAASAEWVGSG